MKIMERNAEIELKSSDWSCRGNQSKIKSASDHYPGLVDLKKRIGARAFAVLADENKSGQFRVMMSSADFERNDDVKAAISTASLKLHSHLRRAPFPLIWMGNNDMEVPTDIPSLKFIDVKGARIGGIAFPVQLGSIGAGYVVFFGPTVRMSRDIQMDLHRRAYSILRELFKNEFSVLNSAISLNMRETECLQLAGNGMKSDDIATCLELSVHTVNAHLSSATSKLDCVNRIQAIAKAIRLGLIW